MVSSSEAAFVFILPRRTLYEHTAFARENINIHMVFLKERSNNGDFFDYHGQNLKKLQVRQKNTGFVHNLNAEISKQAQTNQEILDFFKKERVRS